MKAWGTKISLFWEKKMSKSTIWKKHNAFKNPISTNTIRIRKISDIYILYSILHNMLKITSVKLIVQLKFLFTIDSVERRKQTSCVALYKRCEIYTHKVLLKKIVQFKNA